MTEKPIVRVYQGGHHDVWCDGETHIKSRGGFTQADRDYPSENEITARYKCDCAEWANT